MARKEKELHMQLHPGWSARDNYATHTKKKKKTKRDVIPHHQQQQSLPHAVAGLSPLKLKDDPGQQSLNRFDSDYLILLSIICSVYFVCYICFYS